VTKSETILATLKAHLPELREMGVKDLYVFGSVARGKPDPHDVDVLVGFTRSPGLMDVMGVKFLLEDKAGLPVDLYTMSACPERFRKRIEGELLHVA
jgi:predicted nucleotidyltransferase